MFFDRFSFLKVMFKLKSTGFSIPLYILFFHFTIGAYHLKRAYLLSTLAVVMGILLSLIHIFCLRSFCACIKGTGSAILIKKTKRTL